MDNKARILSGIQPSGSGEMHLGNYFGAVEQFLNMQKTDAECFFFIANLHALTTIKDAKTFQDSTLTAAVNYLAFGLDPERSTFYRQSDIPEVCELAWLLSTVTPMGLLERCHSYKDKIAKGLPAEHGLFAYPVLMAADILMYDPTVVPVGRDQKQHVEVTRDIAARFNHIYGETFILPEPKLNEATAVVPGTDGQKMSKSYGNVIEVFATNKKLKKQVMGIVTDSTPVEDSKNPDECNVIAMMRLLGDEELVKEWEQKYIAGGIGYGDAKKAVLELIHEKFGDAKERYETLKADPDMIEDILIAGAKKARAVAAPVLERARVAVGLRTL